MSSEAGDALVLPRQVLVAGNLTELGDPYLEPAGRLFLKVGQGLGGTRATLRADGAEYPVDLWPGQTAILTLPPGFWKLELPAPDGAQRGRVLEFSLRAGDERRLQLEPGEASVDR